MNTQDIINKHPGYNPGIHCGDKHCYACATQRYRCAWLEGLDRINLELDEVNVRDEIKLNKKKA